MAASKTKIPSAPSSFEIFTLVDDRLVCTHNSRVIEFKNEADLIDGVYRGIYKMDKLRIFVPGSSLRKIYDACVSQMPQTDRIIGYCDTADKIKYYKQNLAEHISWKVQYCLTRNLRSVLNGEEIRSILYQDGPIDQAALSDVWREMQQRLSEKEKAAQSASANISTGSTINERCLLCGQLIATRNSCEFCSTATSAYTLPPTPTGRSPQNDYLISDLIVANNTQHPPDNSDSN